ncbi:MAG: winged helix-turn-helix transcriptional regulator [Firmicutes bacterium]|nr:winged helix-turn-helix transcriptional regulator [Bacillota bacterium]
MSELVKTLKALSDETRYRIVKLLLVHNYCVGALAGRLKISKSAVSQHLKVLRNAGIVKGDKRGYYTHYYVERDILKETAKSIRELSELAPTDSDCCKTSLNHSNNEQGGGSDFEDN